MKRRLLLLAVILVQLACIVASALLWYGYLPPSRSLAAIPLSAGILLLAADTALLCAPVSKRTRQSKKRKEKAAEPGRETPGDVPPVTEPAEPVIPAAPIAQGETEYLRPLGAPLPAACVRALKISWQGGERVVSTFPAIIGRDAAQASIVVDAPGISRRHARIDCEGDTVLLTDLGSSNGTFVNAVSITERKQLQPGDNVRIGRLDIYIERMGGPS